MSPADLHVKPLRDAGALGRTGREADQISARQPCDAPGSFRRSARCPARSETAAPARAAPQPVRRAPAVEELRELDKGGLITTRLSRPRAFEGAPQDRGD
jgi:hypothetical protein